MIPGIDVSSHNQAGGIDWPAVAKYLTGLDPEAFAIVKVSEGGKPDNHYINPYLHQQRQGAHAAGIKTVGLYHFGRPSKNSGADEADWFLECIGNDGGILAGEFLCLDIEDTDVSANADLDAYVLDFAGRVSRPLGRPIILYSGKWYADPHNLNRDPKLAELGLWWASVGSLIPPTPEPWKSAGKSLLLWQHSWHGRVPGIQGDVDLDYLVGGIETLRPYQWGYREPPQSTTDVPLDVDVPSNSERLEDQKRVAAAMRTHTEQIITAPVGAKLADVAAKIKSEADWLVRSTWGH
jgi:GH25 family lysozyme M1 (1,4-beta-N-acetylmuramidase)